MSSSNSSLGINLISGGIAGFSVDCILYPLDTIKTRLQSVQGFQSSGGFRNVYAGLLSVAIGSAPSAAIFFGCYEYSKNKLYKRLFNNQQPTIYQIALTSSICSSLAVSLSCGIRVPVENIKQKLQAGLYNNNTQVIQHIYKSHGFKGFYIGYLSTLAREIPFAFIQFPIYEQLKYYRSCYNFEYNNNPNVSSLDCALIGGLAGSIAAALTTPLDLCKTRIMAQRATSQQINYSMREMLHQVYKTEGINALFSGIIPRVSWIGLGGFIFFGAFEKSKQTITKLQGKW